MLIAGEIECVQLWRPQRLGWERSPVVRSMARIPVTTLIDRVRTEELADRFEQEIEAKRT